MKYTELTEDQLADNFERDLNLCDTPACHGGWAAIMYGLKSSSYSKAFYDLGAEWLAKELGFSDASKLEWWALDYPEYWGSVDGGFMFEHESAFGKKFKEIFRLQDIPDWYMNVVKRLRLRGEDV